MQRVYITSPYITLGQLLKFANVISSGGETKFFLMENDITFNGEAENRRGKKCYPGDQIVINNEVVLQIERKQGA
ncbi:MAG: S4 domain-containing protein YaaA [Candidatus Izemoplasmatales bacterium]